jgi:hypothetical protein
MGLRQLLSSYSGHPWPPGRMMAKMRFMTTRKALHHLADELPDGQAELARVWLRLAKCVRRIGLLSSRSRAKPKRFSIGSIVPLELRFRTRMTQPADAPSILGFRPICRNSDPEHTRFRPRLALDTIAARIHH